MAVPGKNTPPSYGWDGLLDPGEKILWQGQPDSGIRLRVGDYIMIVFGLFFGGFALFWMVLASAAGGGFWAFGLLHFAVGAGITLWPIFGRPYVRHRTWYTLTNKRAFIASKTPFQGKTLNSYPITAGTSLTLEQGPPGSIFFATERRRVKNGTREVRVGFEHIENARDVFGKFRTIQRGEA